MRRESETSDDRRHSYIDVQDQVHIHSFTSSDDRSIPFTSLSRDVCGLLCGPWHATGRALRVAKSNPDGANRRDTERNRNKAKEARNGGAAACAAGPRRQTKPAGPYARRTSARNRDGDMKART